MATKSRMDVKRQQVLSTNQRSQQKEAVTVDTFNDIVYTDETTVQLENHRRNFCLKNGRKPRYKPRPKHPIKVHVWAGISMRGTASICIFEGRMNTPLFTSILEQALPPFMRDVYPDGCRLVQDNDPKHNSAMAHDYYRVAGINSWQTPPESPDLNPIENLWHELKEYIRRVVKPTTKQHLISGILFCSELIGYI